MARVNSVPVQQPPARTAQDMQQDQQHRKAEIQQRQPELTQDIQQQDHHLINN